MARAMRIGKFAQLLGVTDRTARRHAQKGSLRTIHFGGLLLVPMSEVERLLGKEDSGDLSGDLHEVGPGSEPIPRSRSKPNLFDDLFGPAAKFLAANEHLSEREREVLEMRYVEGKTLEEIGSHYGVTREMVRQIILHGFPKLRRKTLVVCREPMAEPVAEAPRIEVRDLPIEDLCCSVRLYNVLHTAGLKTVGDILTQSERSMLKRHQCGKKSLYELKEMLAPFGVALSQNNRVEQH